MLPACNTEAMQLHLDEIATKVTPGADAVLILDQAGWNGAKDLKTPKNISLLRLPPRAPELDRKKISGNSCARTGCRTASSNPSTKSSITAATPGIRSSINRGKSCPSLAAIGQPPVTHCEACYYSSRSCARLRPSPVLARINSRSNSAKPPNTVSVRRPCGLVVSAQTSGVDHEGATRRQQSTSISGKHYPENHKGEGSAPRVWQLPP